jgi:protein tyrosine/serine phosphatase
MKPCKIFTLCFALLLAFLFVKPIAAQNCTASKDLPNYGCVNGKLFRGAQPTEEGIKELARRGIKTIIDLRDLDKNAKTEARLAQGAGIKFYNIPLSNWLGPGDAKIEEILRIIDASGNDSVFVHCKRGADRTGTVIAIYRISHNGWTAEQAKGEARKFRLGWWQVWMKDYIDDYEKEHPENAKDRKTRLQ